MSRSNIIIDLSHHNGPVDLQKAQADGIAGVIHKATQGPTYVDQMFATNRQKAAAAGLLFGASHFGACDRNTFNGILAELKTFWGVENA